MIKLISLIALLVISLPLSVLAVWSVIKNAATKDPMIIISSAIIAVIFIIISNAGHFAKDHKKILLRKR